MLASILKFRYGKLGRTPDLYTVGSEMNSKFILSDFCLNLIKSFHVLIK